MNTLTDFINTVLYPALFNHISEAFPEMQFKKIGGRWKSPYHTDGKTKGSGNSFQSFISSPGIGYLCDYNKSGYNSVSLIDFEIQRNGRNTSDKDALINAVKRLSSLCGIDPPKWEDGEKWQEYKKRQDLLSTISDKMQKALYSQEGVDGLDYLRKVRGYSDEEIKQMGLGYVTPGIKNELITGGLISENTTIGKKHVISIPWASGNRVLGFKFRTIDTSERDKYRFTNGVEKAKNLFGLCGIVGKEKDVTIVEGEFDCLRAMGAGIDNVACVSGCNLSPEHAEQLKRMGANKITLLFDNDDAGRDGTEKAIRTTWTAGLDVYIATLPEGESGEKVDVDSYLSSHSAEDLQKAIAGAKSSYWYIFENTNLKYSLKQREDGTLSDKDSRDWIGETVDLLNAPGIPETMRKQIAARIKVASGGEITGKDLEEEANARRAIELSRTQQSEVIRAAQNALNLANEGKVKESIDAMTSAEKLKRITDISDFSYLLENPTRADIKKELGNTREGIKTGLYFGDITKDQTREQMEELIFPSGQVSLVAGGTTHGKSKFLQNLALSLATDGKDGDTIYFSYEEERGAIMRQFVNIYTNTDFSQNNLRTLEEYYRTGSHRYFHDEATTFPIFQQKENEFFSILESGKLRLFYSNDYSQDLVRAIKFICSKKKIKAVFIDYAQMLYKDGNREARNQELKAISEDLKQVAIDTKTPIILAAQLSREAGHPGAMTAQTLADSADLERYANVVLCIWNCAAVPFKKQDKNDWDNCDLKTALGNKNITLGPGGRGKIYAKLCKNRGGMLNIDTILDFNGNTGKISQELRNNKDIIR